MTRPRRLTHLAECEFRAAVRWYDKVRRGLGKRFATAVLKELARIESTPEFWPVEADDIRQAVLKKWPYLILYRIRPATIRVIAIVHASRDPQEWMDRI